MGFLPAAQVTAVSGAVLLVLRVLDLARRRSSGACSLAAPAAGRT